jgi:hypothetical protein
LDFRKRQLGYAGAGYVGVRSGWVDMESQQGLVISFPDMGWSDQKFLNCDMDEPDDSFIGPHDFNQ